MTLDDILQQIGKPTSQMPGVWSYTRPLPGQDASRGPGISLLFAGDHVVAVSASD
jgi:hypothetical protein